jgi:hypothetical protein
MNTKMFAVTYAVTPKKKFFYQGIYYFPGVEYHFTVLTESNHPGDVFDGAWDDCCRRFDCIDPEGGIVTENFKSLTDPAVKEVKEVSL